MDEADRWVCRGCRTAFWQDTPSEQTDHGLFCHGCCEELGYPVEVVERVPAVAALDPLRCGAR